MSAKGFFQRSANFLAKVRKSNPDISISAGFVSGKLPTNFVEPTEPVRVGFDLTDKAPTYISDPKKLYSIYPAYDNSPSRNADVLYEEVSFFQPDGMKGIRKDAKPAEEIKIELTPTKFRPPRRYQKLAEEAVYYFKQTRKLNYDPDRQQYENNRSARLDRYDRETNTMFLTEASYFDQIGTNIVIDTTLADPVRGHLPSLREGPEKPIHHALPSLHESILANTLGVAAVVYTPDWSQQILRLRDGRYLASMPEGGIHCSASGVFELHQSAKKGGSYDVTKIMRGMKIELLAELHLRPDQYDLHLIALARELPRGGKPQLFFVVRSHLGIDEMVKLSQKAKERSEFLHGDNGGFLLRGVDLSDPSKFTYEGWAAIYFAEQFLEANGLEPDSNSYSSMS